MDQDLVGVGESGFAANEADAGTRSRRSAVSEQMERKAERFNQYAWIREARTASGMSQNELAGRLGVARETVGNWETGVSEPRGFNLVKLREVFEVLPAPVPRAHKLLETRAGEIYLDAAAPDATAEVVFYVGPAAVGGRDECQLEVALAAARLAFLRSLTPEAAGTAAVNTVQATNDNVSSGS